MKYMTILEIKQFFQTTNRCLLVYCLLMFGFACSWDSPNERPNVGNSAPITSNIPRNQTTNPRPSIPSIENNTQQNIIQSALNQIGRPYQFGGNNPNGFDCSGLVQYSYSQAGIIVPRTTSEQLNFFRDIPRSQLQAGDLVFFRIDSRQMHVGIMLNNTDFVHAPSSGKTVSTTNLANSYWSSRFLKAGRYY